MATIIITASCVFLAGAFILYMQGMLDCLFHKDYSGDQMIYLSDEEQANIWDTCRMYPNYEG